ncbi:uncharacterized protein LOC132391292 isoform X1 [Hypanus sabinus]|uniref:uncharacterized protein LOC132391292 isoform X1 n=2 Tax=Hypanus sabinus TaxID=79690 RepID=UPI0028C475B8|nr:uncharacterized protein LOC132391292 isoform X1 [Hypanus sabinus]
MFKRWTSKSKNSVDLSFLSHEEATAILGVLERDKEVQRMNAERLKEIKKKNTSNLWLKGVTGQWFEEIRKAKFKDQTELSKLLKVPPARSFRKKGQTVLSDLKLAQSKNCPEVDNVVSDLQSSDNFKGGNSEDPVSSPPPVAAESDRQNTEALLEQELCSSHKLLQLESETMFQQLQVQLKPAAVPHVKRKVFMYHDIYKHVLDNDHHKVLGQYSETKTNNAAAEQEKITSTENVSSSELQKSTTDDESVRSCAQHGRARFISNNDEMNPAKLSEGTEKTPHIVESNEENARQASDVRPTEQPGDDCTCVDTGHYKADDRISSNSKTAPSSSIIQPKNMLWDQPKINSHDVPIRSNSVCSLPKKKCEIKRTSLFDLLVESRVLLDVSTEQKSCSPNNICEGESANLGEPVLFGSMTGPRSLSKSNEGVPQQNWSDSLMKTSQKTESAVTLCGSTSEDNAVASASELVCNPRPLLSTDTNSRCSIKVQNQNYVTSESDNIGDSSRISRLKHSISLPLPGPGCQSRVASRITVNIRKRKQHCESNDTRFVTPIKYNDGSLQLRRDDKERAALFSSLKAETPSVNILALRKTRMEIATPRDTDDPLPGDENKDCKVERRSNSLLPIRVNGSQLPMADKENDGGQACASSSVDAVLQMGGGDQLQSAKSEMGSELPADPKVAPLHLRNVISTNIGAEQSNPSKDEAVSLVSVNNTLQCGPETSNSIEVSTPLSPNYESQMLFNKKLSSSNNSFTLDDNYIQNIKPSYRITAPKVLSYKYQLLDDSSNSITVTAHRTVDHYKSEPSHALPLPVTTKAFPSPLHTVIVGVTEVPGADDVKNYKPEAAIATSSSVIKQCMSRAFTHTCKGKLSENYPEGRHSSIAQQNRCETFSETVKDWHSTVTKAQLSQGTSLGEGNEYLPKDKSETSSDLKSKNSQFGQCIPATSVDSSQKKSQTNFPLGDITMATISVENCQPGNNIPFSSQDMLTGEQSPSKGHNKADKLLFHSPVRLSTDKDLEDYHSENNPAVLLPDTPFGLRAASSIEHGTKSTLQNWESNTDDNTKIGGIVKECKQADDSKANIIISLPNVVSEQLTDTNNAYVSQDRCLNNIGVSGSRKGFDYLQTLKSEIDTPIVLSRVADQVSPQSMKLSKDRQLNYLLKAIDHTQCSKSEATCASSSSDLVTSQPPFASNTLSNRCESLNYSLDNYARIVTTGFNKTLGKFSIKHCSIDPSLDPGNSPANIVQHLTDRSMSANLDLPSVQLVGQESTVSTPNIKKNVLPPSSGEGPSDQNKCENLAETNTSISSPTGVSTQWYTSNNYPSKSLVHPLDNNGIHVGKSSNQYLENKSGTCAASLSSNVLTDTKAAATNIEINNNTLQHDTSNETLHDKTSSDLSEFKLLHETNNELSSPLVTSKRSPKAVKRTSKDYLQPRTPLGGDITMGRGLRVYLEKDNSELLTSDSLADLQLPLNVMQNITKSPTHFPFIDDISVGSDNEKNVKHCQPLGHNAISPKVSTALMSETSHTVDGVNNVQNVFQSNNGITFYRRTGNSNAQDKSKTLNLIGEQLSTNTNSIPMFSTIPDNKCVSKYESLNYSPVSSIMTEDKANENLQTHTTTTQSRSVTELNSSTNIPQDKILSLTQSPLSYNITLGVESTELTENHQYEEKCPVSSHGQQFLSNLHKDQNEPLTHLLKSGELGINENFKKNKPRITDVISAGTYPSAANFTDVIKNTLQHCTTKVTDIYRRKRPSNRFKLNLLHRAKSVPSLSEMTDQCQTDNISFDNKQGRSRTTPLKENNHLLSSEKYQTVSSTDELHKQYILTNISHDRKDKIQKCLSNIEDRIVNRRFDYNYDLQDGGETKCTPSSLIPVSSHLADIDIAHNVENKPPGQVLNYAVDVVYPKNPDDLENRRPVLSRDEVAQPVSPITTAHSNKNKSPSHSSLIADTILSKKIDNFNTTCVNPSLDPVISQQTSSSSFMTLSDLPNNGAVSAKPAVNKCIQKDATETSKIRAVSFQTGLQTVPAVTDMNQNIGQQNRVFDMGCDKMLNEKSNQKLLRKTNSAPSSPKRDTHRHTADLTFRNQDRTFKLNDEILIGRRNNDCIQRNKLEVNTQFSLPASQQLSPSDIKNNQVKSLTCSPVGSDFEMNVAGFKNVEKAQSQNNRGASLQTPNDLWFSSDSSTEFLSSSPRNDTFLKRIGIDSENDVSLQSPDFVPDPQSSIDVTCSKNRKSLSKPVKIRDGTLDQRWNANCGQTDDLINNSSPLSTSAPVLSPRNIYNHRNYSAGSGSVSPQGNDILKRERKMVRHRRETFPGLQMAGGISGTRVTDRHTLNSFQYCSPPKNQIGSEFMEINNLNRLKHSNFPKYTGSSFSIDKDNHLVNNHQAGTARFSKNYSRFTRSRVPNSQNAQNRYGQISKDTHSHYNQSSEGDQEDLLSTDSRQNSKLTAQKRHDKTSHLFSSYTKRNRLYGSFSDLSFGGKEFDYNSRPSYRDSLDCNEVVNRNEDTRKVSKEAVKKDTHLEKMERQRLWKPSEIHKKASSPSLEDVFDPFPSEINMDPGMNAQTVKNDEYFPVDIKMFWPKENPTDIIRLFSSTSTGSKISEDSLSPQSYRIPAGVLERKMSCYSDTDSDTTTDDEYFLDCSAPAKESAL